MNFNEFLSPEDIDRIDEIELILELNEDNSLLFLIGVDDVELGDSFKNYFSDKLKNLVFYNKFEPKRIFTDLLGKKVEPYYSIDLYSKNYKEENQKEIALDFLFNRDYIPEKGLKLILIVQNKFLDFLMRKASDFISFNNFLHHFKNYKLNLKDSYSTPKLEKAIAEFKEFRKNNPNAKNEMILDKMINIYEIAEDYGEFKVAINYLTKALQKAKKNEYYQGTILGNFGNIYRKINNLNKALNFYQKSLNIFKKVDDEFNIAILLSNIGNIYFSINILNESENYYHKSLNIAKELNNYELIAKIVGSLGNIYLEKNELNKSLIYFKESLKIFKELNNKLNISITYNSIAEVYNKKNDLEEALTYYTKALKLSEELENKYFITMNLRNIANLYTQQNLTHLAKTYYEKALTLAKQQNYANLIKEIEEKLKEIEN